MRIWINGLMAAAKDRFWKSNLGRLFGWLLWGLEITSSWAVWIISWILWVLTTPLRWVIARSTGKDPTATDVSVLFVVLVQILMIGPLVFTNQAQNQQITQLAQLSLKQQTEIMLLRADVGTRADSRHALENYEDLGQDPETLSLFGSIGYLAGFANDNWDEIDTHTKTAHLSAEHVKYYAGAQDDLKEVEGWWTWAPNADEDFLPDVLDLCPGSYDSRSRKETAFYASGCDYYQAAMSCTEGVPGAEAGRARWTKCPLTGSPTTVLDCKIDPTVEGGFTDCYKVDGT